MAKTIVVKGQGTGAFASDNNGGAYQGARTYLDFQGANGAPLSSAIAATVTNNGAGILRITSAGSFTASLVDVYAYINFAATYTDGRYPVNAVHAGGDYIDINIAWSADTTCDVYVGGALNTIDIIRTTTLCANQDRIKITTAGSPYTTKNANNTIVEPGFTVTGATDYDLTVNGIIIEGVLASTGLVDETTKVILDGQPNACTTTALLKTYYVFDNFDCKGASGVGISMTATDDFVNIIRCKVHNNGSHGISGDDNITVTACEIYSNGGSGVNLDDYAAVIDCKIYSNTSFGIDCDNTANIFGNYVYSNGGAYQIDNTYGVICNNIIRATAGGLLRIDSNIKTREFVFGNTFDGVDKANAVTGINMYAVNAPPIYQYFINNIFYKLGTGITCGFAMYDRFLFYRNCFYDCTNNTNANVDTGDMPVTSNPLFTTPGSDYTLQETSPCVEQASDFFRSSGTSSKRDIGAWSGDGKTHSSSGGSASYTNQNGFFQPLIIEV